MQTDPAWTSQLNCPGFGIEPRFRKGFTFHDAFQRLKFLLHFAFNVIISEKNVLRLECSFLHAIFLVGVDKNGKGENHFCSGSRNALLLTWRRKVNIFEVLFSDFYLIPENGNAPNCPTLTSLRIGTPKAFNLANRPFLRSLSDYTVALRELRSSTL